LTKAPIRVKNKELTDPSEWTEFMAKRLLIMALVAVQSASLSGASLFLCIRADGSVCIDGGPAACACSGTAQSHDVKSDSREKPSSCAVGAKSACCTGHGNTCSPCTAATTDRRHGVELLLCAAGDGCDCTHLQISHPQAPTIVARSAAGSGSDIAPFVAPLGLIDTSPLLASQAVTERAARGGPTLVPSLPRMIVAVAVRTC
jgi:hypothetical protein